jgi:hypothetical protein
MKVNTVRLLEHCIDEGIKDALDMDDYERLADKLSNFIWLQLDYYFNFEDNN